MILCIAQIWRAITKQNKFCQGSNIMHDRVCGFKNNRVKLTDVRDATSVDSKGCKCLQLYINVIIVQLATMRLQLYIPWWSLIEVSNRYTDTDIILNKTHTIDNHFHLLFILFHCDHSLVWTSSDKNR